MLRKRTDRKTVLYATLALGAAGFVLRLIRTLTHASSAVPTVLLSILSVLAIAGAVLVALGAAERPGFRANRRRSLALLAQPLGALLLIIAALVQVFTLTGAARFAIGMAGLFAALCIAAYAVQTVLGRVPSALLSMGAAAALFVQMIPQFRAWSTDPVIADYCFGLFAAIAALCLSYHLGGFTLEKGKRKITLFWSVTGLFFSLVSLAEGGAAAVLRNLGWSLLCGAELWLLLTKPKKRRRPPAAAPETEQT